MSAPRPTDDSTPLPAPAPLSPTVGSDEQRLRELGYTQELARSLSGFSNFAVSFSIVSILSGCLTLYGFGMVTGGPALITWGWPVVGLMTLCVGLSMAEICSSYPTAGGLYYWAAKLAPSKAPAWSWFTGWFNFLGQVAVTASVDYGAATFTNALLELQFGLSATPAHTVEIFAVILLVHGLLNTQGVRLVALFNNVSVWWHVFGVLVIVGALVLVPDHHTSASFVFGRFVNDTGFHSSFYVAMLGLLLAQYTLTGYDASAHMTEETHDAARSGPRGIVNSIVVSLVAGWILLLGLTFAIQDYDGALNSSTAVPPAQIFIDAIGHTGAKLLLLIVIGAQFFCGMASVTANSRMIYAFSRDGALPGSRLWHRIGTRTRTPVNAVWMAAVGAFLLGLPALWNSTAFAAVTSVSVIGLYIAYVIPVFLRLRQGDEFPRGPWHLGRWSRVIGTVAVCWTALITVLFMLPTVSPITARSFNYTPVAVAVVLGFAGVWWLVSARRWFTGPRMLSGPPEPDLVAIDLEKS
ncbi:amino acid/polyamine/organocation transporter, APC superfamily [Actinacidiphila yanglinensis]|uniref:Amino acid/polyamine/organocation transporter, APC superfamily n=1 Tax=Actinacidiphila yanglinensis TaxID=310779 RepID=A0A1H6DVG7_9ACTN|nr:amino acid permease [Actinacidiphila yanglinensis]SEG89258.1 amino acid/polyamine/organocation transporter, APC superfamily [Actinacidiphila yanglinensis]